ncbi:protein transport protein sec22 [Pseudozyma hubeiensis SY62]|uniref:Protein transport protein SEC22 n=1 Tax=Pseudozyma hubeiensis (strain SY62) TaxID=1305764 RepID=R9PBV9_PSEHS|nr:protein transport protein sec22 [Pseudozyma hubeiensis SY62]GAC98888.1 protein transport protein sec22 [Pseudozyma hubeiensis SY62]
MSLASSIMVLNVKPTLRSNCDGRCRARSLFQHRKAKAAFGLNKDQVDTDNKASKAYLQPSHYITAPSMPLSTQIARVSDGLPLAQSVDDGKTETDLSEHKQQAKLIFRRITPSSEQRCSIESGKYTLHYLISPPPAMPSSVVYLTIAEKSYPRKLAFSYLDELSKEFERSYGNQVEQRTLRPYAFVSFDTFMQRTKRLYEDSRTAQSAASSNLDRLNEDLQDVTRIMTKNMEDLLWRGDSLDQMSTMSSSLRDESLKYRKAARQINIDALLRKWAPVGAVGFLFLFIIWVKFF